MKKAMRALLTLALCVGLTACGGSGGADYGAIRSDLSAVTPELARAYLAVMDELAAELGYTEAEASEGECLHGGFVRDWDGDGAAELCLLLRTSPRDGGTPRYGWYAPTLRLYTCRDGRAACAGECDLYFATGGREAAVAAWITESGTRYVRWDRSAFADETYIGCFALENGAVHEAEAPAEVMDAARKAETAQDFPGALGSGTAQLLLYNSSGEARLEGEANARALRAALAEKAS